VRSIKEDGRLAPALVAVQRDCAAQAGPLTDEMKGLALNRDRLEVELRNLSEVVAKGGLVAQAVGPTLVDRQTRLNAVLSDIARIEGRLAAAEMTEDQAAALLAQIQGEIATLPQAEPEDQVSSLRTLIAQVTLKPVSKEKGEIDLLVNLPRQSANLFDRAWPMVERGSPRSNTVGWSDTVLLRFPAARAAAS
jgi:hypothetical protein